jgi:hypothetical protein
MMDEQMMMMPLNGMETLGANGASPAKRIKVETGLLSMVVTMFTQRDYILVSHWLLLCHPCLNRDNSILTKSKCYSVYIFIYLDSSSLFKSYSPSCKASTLC